MRKLRIISLIALVVLAGPLWAEEIGELHNLGYVVVSPEGPDDGGDFGPFTPGTTTDGLQEAFDFARTNQKDVYIIGGTTYYLQQTLEIQWDNIFCLNGGEYTISYVPSSGDAIIIDSQMNCRFKFGIIKAPNLTAPDAAVVRIKPHTPGWDNLTAISIAVFEFAGIIGGGDVTPVPEANGIGIGLCLDATVGIISAGRFYCSEIAACDKGVYLKGNVGIADNWIEIPKSHLCDTHFQLGDVGSTDVVYNRFKASINGEAMDGSVGVRILGARNNIFELSSIPTSSVDKDIIFEADARDNLIFALNLPHGITNNATTPTNRIVPLKPVGFSVPTPAVPSSGLYAVNQTSYAVVVTILKPGSVKSWTIKDSNGISQTITSKPKAGQAIYLEPGDAVKFSYKKAPTWAWRAVR